MSGPKLPVVSGGPESEARPNDGLDAARARVGRRQFLRSALGTVAVISKHELLLLMVGGVFVIEAVSVIFQVISFKSRGKRVFKMAPLHHHFELSGWSESKIIIRFWIASVILALFSLSTLKLR